jgi:hypothetical protein
VHRNVGLNDLFKAVLNPTASVKINTGVTKLPRNLCKFACLALTICGWVLQVWIKLNKRESGMVLWSLSIAISVGLLAITAGGRGESLQMAYINMGVAAMINIVFVALALRSSRELQAKGASRMHLSADAARSMSYIYIWGMLGLAVIYATGILQWKEWWQFLLAFMAVGGITLWLGAMMQSRADTGEADQDLETYGRRATVLQLVGMIVVVVGLWFDGKMSRFFVERYTDWAANNIFFFGALALIVISAHALWITSSRSEEAA